MLDMDLMQGRPALRAEYRISLAADVLQSISLVLNAEGLEGLDQWVYGTHAALPPTLKSDMEVALALIQKSNALYVWFYHLPAEDPVHQDFAALIARLNGFTEGDFRGLIDDTLGHLAAYCEEEDGTEIAEPYRENVEQLRSCFSEKLGEEQVERVVHLARNPLELKAQFISIVTRFWEQFYRQEFQRCLPLMQRSVAYHQRQSYGPELPTLFTAVTGRRLPVDPRKFEDVERVVFFPSCHIGPYVMFVDPAELRPTVCIHYNCRPTATPEQEQGGAIQDLFPPLKALADETRLQILAILDGRELYAQEIVEHLDISQSAVSRHLKLMVTGGLLNMRKEDSMKYYSISEETLVALAEGLRRFRGKRNG
jgi:DNA-binding transcriptional ArsR family regulator